MITLSESAVKEIKKIIADNQYLRVAVVGGGCSGYKHTLNLVENFDEKKDNIFEQDDLKIVIDKRSQMYLEGTSIDFIDDLNKRGFSFKSNAIKSTCGCGQSWNM